MKLLQRPALAVCRRQSKLHCKRTRCAFCPSRCLYTCCACLRSPPVPLFICIYANVALGAQVRMNGEFAAGTGELQSTGAIASAYNADGVLIMVASKAMDIAGRTAGYFTEVTSNAVTRATQRMSASTGARWTCCGAIVTIHPVLELYG